MRLTDLSRYNQWWKMGKDFTTYDSDLRSTQFIIERRKHHFDVGNIYIIRGPRRAGKSTFIKLNIKEMIENQMEPKKILYLPCDRLSSRKELNAIIREFLKFNLEAEKIFVFLDEVTYLPEWYLVIKDLAEDPVIDRVCVVATGSSPITLKEASERLPGRKIEGNEFWLMPISFREFIMKTPRNRLPLPPNKVLTLQKLLRKITFSFEKPNLENLAELLSWHDELDHLFELYLRTGGIPEFIVEYLTEKKIDQRKMEMLVRFVLGEIAKAKKSENIAIGILRYLIDNLMQRVDYKKIATEVDAHHATVRDIIETLQKALILFQINHLDIYMRKFQPRKQKKFAFSDTALILALKNYIYGMQWEDIIWEIEKIKPHLVENLVVTTAINSIHKPYQQEWWTKVGYYYTEKYEIDLTILSKLGVQTYEVKYTEKPKTTRAKITITKSDIEPEKGRIPAIYILATAQKSPKIL